MTLYSRLRRRGPCRWGAMRADGALVDLEEAVGRQDSRRVSSSARARPLSGVATNRAVPPSSRG
jgi:hypothetical protein